MQRLGWIILGLAVGLFIGRMSAPVSAPATSESPKEWAQGGVRRITAEKDPQLQLKAAEDYYGKAVVLFLASVVNRTAMISAPSPTTVTALETPEAIAVETAAVAAVPETKPLETPALSVKERRAQEEAQKKQVDLDRMLAYKRSPVADKMSPQVRKLQGYFSGHLQNLGSNRKGRIDPMEVAIEMTIADGKLTGHSLIIIKDPEGKVYSRSNQNGQNQTIRLVPGQANQVYLMPAPGDFILLDIRDGNQLRGEYFDENGALIGRVVLQRG